MIINYMNFFLILFTIKIRVRVRVRVILGTFEIIHFLTTERFKNSFIPYCVKKWDSIEMTHSN
jgi:hypothetical protein